MNHLYPDFRVGQTVYAFEPEVDAVSRGKVREIKAKTDGGEWQISYLVDFRISPLELNENQIHRTPAEAFPPPPPELASEQ